MKVLSIIEPFASLISNKKKFIETRSFKTLYRGELYIHSSLKKDSKMYKDDEVFKKLVKELTLNYGNIICKCNLIDCIYMDEKYIEDMRKDNYQEYICGDYRVGRYAWVLADIQALDIPIKAKGHLGIWNY